jgi:hypothetical protein
VAETTTVEVEVTGIDPSVAEELRPGRVEEIRGRVLATVTGIERENATVVLTSESGEIFAREHPVNQDVTLTIDLATRQTDRTLQFHGRQLTVGQQITLELRSVRVEGTVTAIE